MVLNTKWRIATRQRRTIIEMILLTMIAELMDQTRNTHPQCFKVLQLVRRCLQTPEDSVKLVWLRWTTTLDLATILKLDQLKKVQKRARSTEIFPAKPVMKAEKYWLYLDEKRPRGERKNDSRLQMIADINKMLAKRGKYLCILQDK